MLPTSFFSVCWETIGFSCRVGLWTRHNLGAGKSYVPQLPFPGKQNNNIHESRSTPWIEWNDEEKNILFWITSLTYMFSDMTISSSFWLKSLPSTSVPISIYQVNVNEQRWVMCLSGCSCCAPVTMSGARSERFEGTSRTKGMMHVLHSTTTCANDPLNCNLIGCFVLLTDLIG